MNKEEKVKAYMEFAKVIGQAETQAVVDFYQASMMRALTKPLWLDMYRNYAVPVPWHVRLRRRMHWHTIGRFQRWLHRDCGDY